MNFWNNLFSKTYKILISSGILLVAIYIILHLVTLKYPHVGNTFLFQFFDLGHEANLPTYFSVLLFFVLSTISWLIYGIEKKLSNNYKPWILTTFLFIFLGLDELAQVHEQLTYHFQVILNTQGFLYFAWIIPYGFILLLFSFYYLPFIWKLKNRKVVIIGAIVFLSGAIGLEMIGARYYQMYGSSHYMYIIISSIEETLELAGLLIAIYALKKELLYKLEENNINMV